MPPKPKRTSQTRTRSSAKRARVTDPIASRPGPSDQQAETSTEQPLMAVNMQALSASISSAVQLAVAEAMKTQWPASPSQETHSSTDQSVANILNTSLAEITQGTPSRSQNVVTLDEPGLDSPAPNDDETPSTKKSSVGKTESRKKVSFTDAKAGIVAA